MEAALEHFNIDVTGMTCLDAGLSTGGFTDCLLQKGAVKVYGIDVGFGQVRKYCIHLPLQCLVSADHLHVPAVSSPKIFEELFQVLACGCRCLLSHMLPCSLQPVFSECSTLAYLRASSQV